jgi:type II secretory pathway component PulC
LLLSKDRNPAVVVDVAPPKPMPALPRVYGVMSLGGAPRVVMSPAKGGDQRSYLPGESIGEFKLVQVTQRGVVFEWDGQAVGGTFEELKDDTPPPQTSAPASSSPAPAKPAAVVSSVGASSAKGPGELLTGSEDTKACVDGDNSPAGTVNGGFRKVVTRTPFGEICRWEKVK